MEKHTLALTHPHTAPSVETHTHTPAPSFQMTHTRRLLYLSAIPHHSRTSEFACSASHLHPCWPLFLTHLPAPLLTFPLHPFSLDLLILPAVICKCISLTTTRFWLYTHARAHTTGLFLPNVQRYVGLAQRVVSGPRPVLLAVMKRVLARCKAHNVPLMLARLMYIKWSRPGGTRSYPNQQSH